MEPGFPLYRTNVRVRRLRLTTSSTDGRRDAGSHSAWAVGPQMSVVPGVVRVRGIVSKTFPNRHDAPSLGAAVIKPRPGAPGASRSGAAHPEDRPIIVLQAVRRSCRLGGRGRPPTKVIKQVYGGRLAKTTVCLGRQRR